MSENEVIGYISAIQTLIDNFPLNILEWISSHGKKYSSVLDFLLDVIFGIIAASDDKKAKVAAASGATGEQKSTVETIETFFEEIVEFFVGINYDVAKSVDNIDIENNTINKIEDAIKGAIAEILTAILSCSAIPEIKTENMDKSGNLDRDGKVPREKISIPIAAIDLFNKLNINPCHEIGKTYYDVNGENLSQSTLYKTKDLDAFIWYVINKGHTFSQLEMNKMMWDNRRSANFKDFSRETTEVGVDRWSYWLDSKKSETESLYCLGDTVSGETGYSGKMYKPILQFEPNFGGANPRIDVLFPQQTYHNKHDEDDCLKNPFLMNHTMFKFNWDYLSSFKMFSLRVIIANIINGFTNGFLTSLAMSEYNLDVNMQYIADKVSNVIKEMISADDLTIDDCSFTFSNEEYDKMLYNRDLEKFGIQYYNNVNGNVTLQSEDDIINALNTATDAATLTQTTTTVAKTLYDISATAATSPELAVSVQFNSNYMQMVYNFIMCLIMPMISSIISPKVILLFILNFQVTGLIDLEKLANGDMTELMGILYNKLLSLIKALISYIKDVIVVALMDKLEKYLAPLLTKYCLAIMLERLAAWTKIIEEAMKCVPILDITLPKLKNQLDDVDYADIDSEQTTPSSKSNC